MKYGRFVGALCYPTEMPAVTTTCHACGALLKKGADCLECGIAAVFDDGAAALAAKKAEERAKAARRAWARRPAIIRDTREPAHTVYDFAPLGAMQITQKLEEGDYSLVGCEDILSVERKTLPDAVACVGRERDRFERCLERLAEIAAKPEGYACVVIEGTLEEAAKGIPESLVHGHAIVGSFLAWSVRYKVPFFFCGDRRHALAATAKIIEKFWDGRVKAQEAECSQPTSTT